MFAVILWWPQNLARAGPPLIADDPNTVGPGVVQPIFAASAVNRGDETLVRGPTADVTIGLVDSLDAIVVASLASLHDASENPRWTLSGLFAVGVKWQFFRGDRGSLAFSPTFVMDTKVAQQPAGLLPMQGELALGNRKASIGFDIGYVPIRRADDEWFVALYVNWAVTRRLNVLGEVWSVSFGRAEAADIGTSLGIDYGIFGNELRLLAAVSTGIASVGRPRIDIRAYVGAQFTFGSPRNRWKSTRSNGFE
ncbi:MAG: hypothetical protein OER77_02520 [Myxococcales bacterium]|nr:hypothetical protein [Myxococcales bacterium]